MSIEARNLAKSMNELDLSAEKLEESNPLYQRGLVEYQNIKRRVGFILPSGIEMVVNYLNDNGKIVYERFYKKLIEEELKPKKKK